MRGMYIRSIEELGFVGHAVQSEHIIITIILSLYNISVFNCVKMYTGIRFYTDLVSFICIIYTLIAEIIVIELTPADTYLRLTFFLFCKWSLYLTEGIKINYLPLRFSNSFEI